MSFYQYLFLGNFCFMGEIMTRRKTEEEAEEIVSKYGFHILNIYVKDEASRVIMIDEFGYKYDISLKDFSNKKNKKVNFVDVSNPFSIENIKLWIHINNKPFEIYEKYSYKDSKEKISLLCHKCEEIFYSSWNDIHSGRGCSFCGGKKIGNKNNLAFLFPELLEEWDYSKNNILPTEIAPKAHRGIWWICKKCNYSWNTFVSKRTSDKTGCPVCKSSKGEKKIFDYLSKIKIKFTPEKTFSNCVNLVELPFDFYLPDYNLCIEYDGTLHFEDKFNNPKEFKLTKKRDKIKTKYCKNNGINLLRIPYWEFDNIEEILEQTLSELG